MSSQDDQAQSFRRHVIHEGLLADDATNPEEKLHRYHRLIDDCEAGRHVDEDFATNQIQEFKRQIWYIYQERLAGLRNEVDTQSSLEEGLANLKRALERNLHLYGDEEGTESHRFNEGVRSEIRLLHERFPQGSDAEVTDEAQQDNMGVAKTIQWLGTETQIVYLFDRLIARSLISTDEQYAFIARHFTNRNGRPFKNTQLAQTAQNYLANSNRKPRGAGGIDDLLDKMEGMDD